MRLSIAVLLLFCIVACAHATFAPVRRGQPSFPYPGTGGGWPPKSTGPTFPRPSKNPISRFRREAAFTPSRGSWPPRSSPPIPFPHPPKNPFNHRFRREAAFTPSRGSWPPRSTGPTFPRPPKNPISRFRREAAFTPSGGSWPPRSSPPITFPRPPKNPFNHRFRREARPQQNSISLEGVKPLSGPNRQPSLDLNYNHRVFEDHRGNVDAYGGANWVPGRVSPHAGVKFERNYGNGFIGGYGQVQPGPRGHVDPSFGIRGGFRF